MLFTACTVVGTSSDSCSNTYSGPHYESEVEAAHMTSFLTSHMGEWEVYLTLHSKGQLWMAPWGYTTDPPQDYDELVSFNNLNYPKNDLIDFIF